VKAGGSLPLELAMLLRAASRIRLREVLAKNWSSVDFRAWAPGRSTWYVDDMRTMQIRPFPGSKIQITDLGFLIKERLVHDRVLWPDQALPLVGYMAWPNDSALRQRWLEAHRRNDQSTIKELTPGLKIIQQHWARIADIVHLHMDLAHGGHQRRRGGPSLAKSISLIAAKAKSKGTGTAKLWELESVQGCRALGDRCGYGCRRGADTTPKGAAWAKAASIATLPNGYVAAGTRPRGCNEH
jgi:hypothetical protein